MSSPVRHLPEIIDLKKLHAKYPDDSDFIKAVIGKADLLVGSSESQRYIEEIQEKIKKNNGKNN